MFDAGAKQEIGGIAGRLGIEPAALLAVVDVESNGQPFAQIDGRPMPLIRWEGHYFHRLLPAALRKRAFEQGLAHPRMGVVKNPVAQAGRYAILGRGKAIDEEAAIGACSWGLGQVMGAHWQWLGFSSAHELERLVCSGIAGQVELMARFIEKSRLVDELARRDWAAFARAYNGPSYREHEYDRKMAAAYRRYVAQAGPARASAGDTKELAELRLSSRGPAVRQLQERLRGIGYPCRSDGDFGPATRKAVRDFQRDEGLPVDGRVGPQTWALLDRRRGFDPAAEGRQAEPKPVDRSDARTPGSLPGVLQ